MKILHIGNIAGNAYQAVFFERSIGKESFVVNPDLNHVMSHPIWEEETVDFELDLNDINTLKSKFPYWQDPSFYIHGSLYQCLEELAEILRIPENEKVSLIETLTIRWRSLGSKVNSKVRDLNESRFALIARLKLNNQPDFTPNMILKIERFFLIIIGLISRGMLRSLMLLYKLPLAALITLNNPLPASKLKNKDLSQLYYLAPSLKLLSKIGRQFDQVVLYGPWAALAAFEIGVKFVSVEHGTLRNFIFENHAWARATRLGYSQSKSVLVTNADCLPIAHREKYKKIVPSIHPFNLEFTNNAFEKRLFLLSSRQPLTQIVLASRIQFSNTDDAKGSEISLKAIKMLHEENKDFTFKCFAYGENLALAHEYIRENRMQNYLTVSSPLSRKPLLDLFARSLCVLDGFSLSGIGRIQIESWCVGVPVLSKHDDSLNKYFFSERVPTLNSSTTTDIIKHVNHLVNLSNSQLAEKAQESRNWFIRYHSPERFEFDLLR